jgi:predicted DsbA family dithiol-disulfide isomerase
MTNDSLRIDVWSDYVCPWCFMGGLSLKRLGETEPLEVEWHAFELRPKGSPPISREYRARIEAGRPVFAARLKRDYGIEINQGPFEINTQSLHALKKYADAQGKGNEFHQAALDAYWMHARDVSAPNVQRELLAQVGLDANLEEILAQEAYRERVIADEQFAYENEITGVPALVFDQKYLVVGAQPVDVLKQVAAKVKAEQETPS